MNSIHFMFFQIPIEAPEHLLIYFKNNFFLPHSMKTKVPFEKSSELAEPYNHHSREKQKISSGKALLWFL